MISNLEKKLIFIELLDEMKNIKRALFLRNWNHENDAEHSFHLAFMIMIFIDDFPFLDMEKCLKLALVHDIVEIFAWDTVVYDKVWESTKEKREKEALKRFEEILWKEYFFKYKALIKEYDERKTKEAKFVYQLDKIQPKIQIIMEWWKSWKTYKVKKKDLLEKDYKKVDSEFWFDKILDIYFKKAEKWNMFYIWD